MTEQELCCEDCVHYRVWATMDPKTLLLKTEPRCEMNRPLEPCEWFVREPESDDPKGEHGE